MKRLQSLSYKTLFTILFLSLAGIVFFIRIGGNTQKVSAAWWDEMWHYRKAISISNTSGSTLNYQRVKIIIDTASLITAGKLQTDCDDIRITDINGNLLDHWDTECNTSSSSIYFKMASIPTTENTIYFYYGNPAANSSEKTLGSFENPGTSCQMMKNQGSVTTNGTYYIVPGGADIDKQLVYCDQTTDGGGWTLVMNQKANTGGFFTNSTQAQSYNELDPTADRYSILGKLGKFKDNGVFTFKINWPALGSTRNIWSQTSNPINEIIAGYTGISINQTGSYWGGIAPSSSPSTFIDGSPGNGTWYYAIASYVSYNGGIPHYGEPATNQTQLWVKGNDTMNNVSIGTSQSEESSGAPIAYWKFDEGVGTTVYDSAGTSNGVFGTGSFSPNWADESQCISGKCLKFDGVNDYVSAGIGTDYLPLDTFSMCAWVKSPGLASGMSLNGIMSYTYGLTMALDSAGQFWTRIDNGSNLITVTTPGNLYDNKFHHVCVTFDGTNRNLYVDGKLKEATATTWNNRYSSNSVNIGHENNNSSIYKFNGFIDEPKIYRYARTADQIKKDYNSRGGSSQGTSANLGTAGSDNNLSEGLVGYWKMDEGVGTSITDSSGNSNTGIFGTGSSAPGWISGKYGVGTSFDGVNDYIDAGNILNMGTNDMTISTWIKTTNSSSTSQYIVSKSLAASQNYRYGIFTKSGTAGIFMQGDGGADVVVYGTKNIADGNWHIITAVFNRNDKANIYVDGVYDTGQTISQWYGKNMVSTNPFRIGAYTTADNTGVTFLFNGLIDEVRIYNRALSPSEVTQLYEYAPGPVGYWDFDEKTGTIAEDKSGNNNNGALINSPFWAQGKIGGALNFNGTNNYVNAGNAQSLNPHYAQTISSWVKLDTILSNQTSNYPQIMGKRDTDTQRAYFLAFEKASSKLYWEIKDSVGTYYTLYSTKTNWNVNEWYYITATFDGSLSSNNSKIFVNGILDNQSTWNLTYVPQTSAATKIGGGNYYLDGSLDEVKLYNYARTQKQIIEDMNAGAPATSSKSMIAYYKFDEGNGTTAYNSENGGSSLNGTFGTGSSAPTWLNEGKLGKALSFNGISNYYNINDPGTNSSLDLTDNLTISAWVKKNQDSNYSVLIDKSYSNAWSWYLHGNGSMQIDAMVNGTYVSEWVLTSTNIFKRDIWQHIVWTYDGVTAKIYVNGSKQNITQKSNTGPLGINNSPIKVGIRSDNYGPFNGLIDEVKIYNYALTPEEVKQDYNAGSAIQFGSTSQSIGGTTTSLEYCIPGDTSYCAPPYCRMENG